MEDLDTIAHRVINFYRAIAFEGELPEGIGVINPFRDDPRAMVEQFYRKFYDDTQPRKLILGINPGRLGVGATGIPFTDPKRLVEKCGIPYDGPMLHEPSSVFVYELVDAFGGVHAFYGRFYINSVFPLVFTQAGTKGKAKNYNYYDSAELRKLTRDFITWNIREQQRIAGKPDSCFCLGTGKNYEYLQRLNEEEDFFRQIIPLEHPRYIVQYKQKEKGKYIDDFQKKLSQS